MISDITTTFTFFVAIFFPSVTGEYHASWDTLSSLGHLYGLEQDPYAFTDNRFHLARFSFNSSVCHLFPHEVPTSGALSVLITKTKEAVEHPPPLRTLLRFSCSIIAYMLKSLRWWQLRKRRFARIH